MRPQIEEQRLYEHNKQQMYRRDNWHCRHCNCSSSLTPHHVIYQSAGGVDTLDNLLTLCLKCHNDVHEGRLRIEILRRTTNNLVVKFWKLKGWKP
jgi:5-methylcytosine-specific restriction endonuclease McrA